MKQTGQAQEESKPQQQGISGFIQVCPVEFNLYLAIARGLSKAVLNTPLAI